MHHAHEHVDMIYLAKATSMELKPDDGETTLTKEEIESRDDIGPWMRRLALFALKTVK